MSRFRLGTMLLLQNYLPQMLEIWYDAFFRGSLEVCSKKVSGSKMAPPRGPVFELEKYIKSFCKVSSSEEITSGA